MVAVPSQEHYPVTDETGKIVGVLSMPRLGGIGDADSSKVLVKDVAGGPVDYADAGRKADEMLSGLLSREFVLVVDSGRVVGYLTPNRLVDIARFYGLRRGI